MSAKRNRGKQSNDDKLFSERYIPILIEAANDLSLLLSRGYSQKSALLLVGNRYKLSKRQRNAIMRISCAAHLVQSRDSNHIDSADLEGATIAIDGFNLLILLESVLSGAFVFKCRDGLYRDISSVHGSYKRVEKTYDAIELIGQVLNDLNIASVQWYLDRPVSNSGKMKTLLMEYGRENNYNWMADLVFDPDTVLAQSPFTVISSDGWILDNADKWFNLGAFTIERYLKSDSILII